MLDAIVGAVIMGVASTSLLFAVEVVEDAFREAGGYPVSPDEQSFWIVWINRSEGIKWRK